jgi:hypothetical protein
VPVDYWSSPGSRAVRQWLCVDMMSCLWGNSLLAQWFTGSLGSWPIFKVPVSENLCQRMPMILWFTFNLCTTFRFVASFWSQTRAFPLSVMLYCNCTIAAFQGMIKTLYIVDLQRNSACKISITSVTRSIVARWHLLSGGTKGILCEMKCSHFAIKWKPTNLPKFFMFYKWLSSRVNISFY